MSLGVRRRETYFSSEKTTSACARSRSRITGCGSTTSASAASTTSSRMPRVSASARTPASHSVNVGRGAVSGSCAAAEAVARTIASAVAPRCRARTPPVYMACAGTFSRVAARAMLSNLAASMPDLTRRRVSLEIPWRTLLKLAAFASLVWLWLQLIDVILVVIVAVLLAVTFNPLVARLEKRGLSRGQAAGLFAVASLALVGGFLWVTWSSLAVQARYAVEHIAEFEREVMRRLPPLIRNAIGATNAGEIQSYAAPYALRFVQSTMSALTISLLGFVLTIYLLVEGRATRDWLVAFVPLKHRGRTERTLAECERVIYGYVAGNAITSVIAFVCTPAALLLAVMAGISDFVPVIGFFVTMVPAVLLALTVSGTTALLVTAFYIAYNTVENYFISPWAYGGRLRLSNLAVILAFVVGAEIAGVIGALIALPMAAIYPAIEEIWLREKLGAETVREHVEIEQREE